MPGATAGLTIEQVATRLEWSSGKISKIENARVGVLPRDVKFLLGVYGLGEGAPEREVRVGSSSGGSCLPGRRRRG